MLVLVDKAYFSFHSHIYRVRNRLNQFAPCPPTHYHPVKMRRIDRKYVESATCKHACNAHKDRKAKNPAEPKKTRNAPFCERSPRNAKAMTRREKRGIY